MAESKIYCPHCGQVNDYKSTFCSNCGANIQNVQPKSVPTQTQIYTPPPQHTTTYVVSQPPPPQSNGAAVASLVTGLIGFILQFIPFVNIVSPVLLIIAFITGIIGLTKPTGKGMAIAGLILSLIDVIIFILFFIFLSALFLPFL